MNDFNARLEYAWKYFFALYYKRLVYYVHTLVNNLADAEDVVSACFEKMWKLETLAFETPDRVKAFLYISARHEAWDQLGRHSNTHSHPCEQLTLERLENANGPLPEEGKVQTLIRIREYIERMPVAIKEVLLMRFFEGMRTIDIARAKQISKQTVSNQVSAGIRKLKQLLQVPAICHIWLAIFGTPCYH